MDSAAKNWTVLSLGGSLIVPERIDAEYLVRFVAAVKDEVARGGHVAIITGGGKVAREYRDALRVLGITDVVLLDQVGIVATRLNAELVREAFGGVCEPAIFLDPTVLSLTGKPVLVGGGWKPGHSSDGAAVGLAKALGARKLVNLSNIDYVYTADPRKDPTATPIEAMTWPAFRAMLPQEWDPGASAPFDPVAAAMAQEAGIEVAVMNGHDLENLTTYVKTGAAKGTIIK